VSGEVVADREVEWSFDRDHAASTAAGTSSAAT
jgi:hypothetical protein